MSEVNQDPIAWWWNPDVDAPTLGQMLTNNKGRLISLDVFFSGNQQRLAAAWVSNTGNQNQAWWWNPNVDAATLGQMLADNKGRLVVLEPFVVNDQLRLAAVWVSNVGPGGQAWWWNPNVDPATLGTMLENNKGRLTTLRTYVLGGRRRYAAAWVQNTGANAHAWWWNPDVDADTLADMLTNNKGRLISLDPYVVGGSVRLAAAWLENTGSTAKTWWWYHGVDAPWLGKTFDRFCAYPVELRTYSVDGTRKIAAVMNSYSEGLDPEGAKLVHVTGTGSLTGVTNNIAPLDESLSVSLELANKTSETVKITEAQLLLTQEGGWVETYFTQPLLGSGNVLGSKSKDMPAGQTYAGSKSFGWGIGATYFIARLKAQTGTKKQHSHTVIPTVRSGYTPPSGFTAPKPVFIGLWTNPSEVVPLWLGNKQTRWLTVGGNIFNGSGQTARLVGWHLTFEADGKVVVDRNLGMNFHHYVGDEFKPLPAAQAGEMALTETLAYFVYGFDVGSAPHNFSKGLVRLVANYKIGDRCGAAVCETFVTVVTPVTLASPVTGRWNWGNSPNHTSFDAHAWPHQRFAVDLTKVNSNNSPLKPDHPENENDSFYAYGEPVLAMKGGTVIKSWDKEDENFGRTANPNIKDINYVLIQHGPNQLTGYYHLRKGKNLVNEGDTVLAGQQLGQVGNSGGSSEPHLHTGWCELDATGRGTLRPMQITGLRTTSNLAVTGVPGTAVYLSGAQVIAEAESTSADAAPAGEPPAVRCSIPAHAAMMSMMSMMREITDEK
jgi:Peptidase family M23